MTAYFFWTPMMMPERNPGCLLPGAGFGVVLLMCSVYFDRQLRMAWPTLFLWRLGASLVSELTKNVWFEIIDALADYFLVGHEAHGVQGQYSACVRRVSSTQAWGSIRGTCARRPVWRLPALGRPEPGGYFGSATTALCASVFIAITSALHRLWRVTRDGWLVWASLRLVLFARSFLIGVRPMSNCLYFLGLGGSEAWGWRVAGSSSGETLGTGSRIGTWVFNVCAWLAVVLGCRLHLFAVVGIGVEVGVEVGTGTGSMVGWGGVRRVAVWLG